MVEKFKQVIKKELLYYLLTLLVLALVMHSDLLNNPLARLETMDEKGNYFHPFLYSFFIYAAFLFIRKAVDFILGIFSAKEN